MFKSIFTNSFGILFSRILGFIRDLLTASLLGANIYSDIFFIAFKLPNLMRRIFAEGAFVQAFLPALTRSNSKSVFSVHIFNIFFITISLITLVVNLFPHIATQLIALGYDKSTIEMAAPFVGINFFYLPLIFIVTFLSTFLHYKNHFATTSFGTALLNIALIIALLLSQHLEQEQIVYYLSYGVVAGGLLQLIVHLIAIYKLNLLPMFLGGVKYYKVKLPKVKKQTNKFYKQFFPAVWGSSTAQFSAFLDTWLATFLVSGTVSYLYYANRVFQLPLALFAIATSIALFPKIARYLKNEDSSKALDTLKKALLFLSALLLASFIIGYLLSEEIIMILFEHGAFTHYNTLEVSPVLQMYMIGLLPFGLHKLFALWLYANEQQAKAAKIATIALGSNIVLSLALIMPMGAMGLALASSMSGFISFGLTLNIFGKKNFLAIISKKLAVILFATALVSTFVSLLLKELFHVYF
jgi:putative peptidoglycan lipid II flippase